MEHNEQSMDKLYVVHFLGIYDYSKKVEAQPGIFQVCTNKNDAYFVAIDCLIQEW